MGTLQEAIHKSDFVFFSTKLKCFQKTLTEMCKTLKSYFANIYHSVHLEISCSKKQLLHLHSAQCKCRLSVSFLHANLI